MHTEINHGSKNLMTMCVPCICTKMIVSCVPRKAAHKYTHPLYNNDQATNIQCIQCNRGIPNVPSWLSHFPPLSTPPPLPPLFSQCSGPVLCSTATSRRCRLSQYGKTWRQTSDACRIAVCWPRRWNQHSSVNATVQWIAHQGLVMVGWPCYNPRCYSAVDSARCDRGWLTLLQSLVLQCSGFRKVWPWLVDPVTILGVTVQWTAQEGVTMVGWPCYNPWCYSAVDSGRSGHGWLTLLQSSVLQCSGL